MYSSYTMANMAKAVRGRTIIHRLGPRLSRDSRTKNRKTGNPIRSITSRGPRCVTIEDRGVSRSRIAVCHDRGPRCVTICHDRGLRIAVCSDRGSRCRKVYRSLAEPRLLGRGEGLGNCLYATCSPGMFGCVIGDRKT